jgi:tRNA threonylcarbamoyladenosine dehydratase
VTARRTGRLSLATQASAGSTHCWMNSYEARFGGLARLFGRTGLDRLRCSHVCVVGVGGVGSWAAEALARSGIGALTLVDLDDVCISNVNRQLHALDGEFGKPKVDVLAHRIRAINPDCAVRPVRAFFTLSNAEQLLSGGFEYLLDAIDSPSRKCILISRAKARRIPVITTGGSAGRSDPTAVQVKDLAFSTHDRLLQEVRKKLRVRDGFPRDGQPFGVPCVCSAEPLRYPTADGRVCAEPAPGLDLRLDCQAGLGTASFVTGAFGLAAASHIVRSLASNTPRLEQSWLTSGAFPSQYGCRQHETKDTGDPLQPA